MAPRIGRFLPGGLAGPAVLVALALPSGAAAATITDLGPIVPTGMNNTGDVVGVDPHNGQGGTDLITPVYWSHGTLTQLTLPAGAASGDAYAINASGRIAGDADVDNGAGSSSLRAFVWNRTGPPQPLGVIGANQDVPGLAQAVGVDAAGDVAGTAPEKDVPDSGFFAPGGGALQRVGRANAAANEGTDVGAMNAQGHLLGSVAKVGRPYYIWSSPSAAGTPLALTPATNVAALFGHAAVFPELQNALASDDTVVGTTQPAGSNVKTWYVRLPNGTTNLMDNAVAPGEVVRGNAVNAKHVVVGNDSDGVNPASVHAAMWKDGVQSNVAALLPPNSGWGLITATAVNDNGDIAGIGTYQNEQRGFLIRLGYTVDSAGDQPDANTADGACGTSTSTCTLRAAIQQVDADNAGTPTQISFAITTGVPAGTLAKITPATPLPAITSPVRIDGTGQPGALTAGPRKLGVVISGSAAGAQANGLNLAGGSAGSSVQGLQIQNFDGDGVRLGDHDEQLANSLLTEDRTGAEVAAANVTVGSANGLPGNIFYLDGDVPGLAAHLQALKGQPQQSVAAFQLGLAPYGAGIVMAQSSSGTRITGNEIGVHGPGFSSAPDVLGDDGPVTKNLAGNATLMPFGVLIEPTAGSVSDVTFGGSGADANVVSGTVFGVAALAGGGATINALRLRDNTFGTERDGTTLSPFGGFIGLMATGNVNGLSIGAPGAGNRFRGELFGTLLLGDQLSSPVVQGNTYGVESTLNDTSDATGGQHDIFGLILGDVVGAQIGGTGPGEGNALVGDYIGLMLAGTKTKDVAVAGNTIGSANPTHFTTFAKVDLADFRGGLGVLMNGNAVAGQSSLPQNISFDANAFQGNIAALLSEQVTGMTLRDNTIADNMFGLIDGGSGATHVGTPGHGNAFLDNGLGLLLGNEEPDPDQLKQAQVNATTASPATRKSLLTVVDEDLGFAAVDAVTTAGLGADSAAVPTLPGTANTIVGNTIGVDATGAPHPNELPILITGDEHDLQFGGLGAGEGNTVVGNRADGVVIGGHGTHQPTVQVLGNTIYDNENFTSTTVTGIPGLGIDLVGTSGGFGFGVNPQDATQPDVGPNRVQNAPVLQSAVTSGGQIAVAGALHGVPQTPYLLEVFADDRPNPFGAGEGQRLLGRVPLTTDGAGDATLAATFPAPPASARFVSATATTQPTTGLGVTSEFAIDTPIVPGAPAPTPTQGPGAPAPKPPVPNAPPGATTTGVKSTGTTASTGGATVSLPVVVSCSTAAASSCTVVTTAAVAPAVSRAIGARAKRPAKLKARSIGSSRITLRAGTSRRLTLKLSARGLRLLKARHAVTTIVAVRITGKGRRSVAKTLRVRLTYKARKRALAERR